MIKTKAAFRALRESCGMTQRDVADEAGVAVFSVKRWENEDDSSHQPPDDVWEWLVECHQGMVAEARESAAEVLALADEERNEGPIAIRYYRTQEALDEAQLPMGMDRPVGYVNAIAMRSAEIIEEAGRETVLAYDCSMAVEPVEGYAIQPFE